VRTVAGPEQLEELLVRDDRRIEVERERLGVVTDVVIGRFAMLAARVADAGADDSWQTPEPGVRGPESTERERRGLDVHGR
jgi:hypothetical protein